MSWIYRGGTTRMISSASFLLSLLVNHDFISGQLEWKFKQQVILEHWSNAGSSKVEDLFLWVFCCWQYLRCLLLFWSFAWRRWIGDVWWTIAGSTDQGKYKQQHRTSQEMHLLVMPDDGEMRDERWKMTGLFTEWNNTSQWRRMLWASCSILQPSGVDGMME